MLVELGAHGLGLSVYRVLSPGFTAVRFCHAPGCAGIKAEAVTTGLFEGVGDTDLLFVLRTQYEIQ